MDLPTPPAGDALREVAVALGRTQPGWLLAAIVLHVAGQLCRGLAWHDVLLHSWPAVTRRRACMGQCAAPG